jgi:hypothetical protein
MKRISLFVLLLSVVALSCGRDNPVGSEAMIPFPRSVAITIGSTDITDQSIMPGMGSSTLFHARPTSVPPGLTVWVHYQGPSMMMHGSGDWMMYDDGTHGDPKMGDGEYCYQDLNQMNLHMHNAISGHYTFDFYCMDSSGEQGEHHSAWVDVR